MQSDYNVFISAKNLDADGRPTKDRKIAFELWEYLEKRGFRVFFSDVSLECMGVSEYTTTIDDALDLVQVLVVVCSSRAHVDSRWVKYEWESFLNDIRSGNKPDGRVREQRCQVNLTAKGVGARQVSAEFNRILLRKKLRVV